MDTRARNSSINSIAYVDHGARSYKILTQNFMSFSKTSTLIEGFLPRELRFFYRMVRLLRVLGGHTLRFSEAPRDNFSVNSRYINKTELN